MNSRESHFRLSAYFYAHMAAQMHTISSKGKYAQFIEQNPQPFFYAGDWLDAVCGPENWNVLVTGPSDGAIAAAFPYCIKRRAGFRYAGMPLLTPYLGPCIQYPSNVETSTAKQRFEKKVVNQLTETFPRWSYFNQFFHPNVENWMPWHWNGFSQSTFYTYRLALQTDIQQLQHAFESHIRNDIRKAEKSMHVIETEDIDIVYGLNKKTFVRQGIKVPHSKELLERADAVLRRQYDRRIYLVENDEGQHCAAVYVAIHAGTAYTLLIASDPAYRMGGAVQLGIWHAIQALRDHCAMLDFCGSMLPNVSRVFRAFGATQTPYFRIYRYGNRFYRMLHTLINPGL